MRMERVLWVVLPLAMACNKGESGGGSSVSSGTPSAQPQASTAASASGTPSAMASTNTKHKRPFRGGMTGILFHAASTLELKDDQKTKLDRLEEDLHGDMSAQRAEMKAAHEDLVAGIKAGKIDTAKMEAHHAAMQKAMDAFRDKEATALNGLHAMLDPAQRKALVAAARAKQGGHHDGKEKGAEKGAMQHDWAKGRMERLTKELDLDADQQKKLEGMMPKGEPKGMAEMREDMKKKMDALLTAFEGDTFDAKKLDLFKEAPKKGPAMDHEIDLMTKLVPILKPEQREKLAKKMEERAQHPGMGMGMGMGGHMGPGSTGEPGGEAPANP